MWFVLNLFFFAGERLPPQLVWGVNKRKCTKLEKERLNDDLKEINDTELDYLHFGKDLDEASSRSDEDFVLQKSLFYFKQFNIVWTSEVFQSEIFCTGKHIVYFQMWRFFLIETFLLTLCNFNVAENVHIVGTAFWKKCKYLQSFQF